MIDYSLLPLSKGTPRIVDRIRQKQELAAKERACRRAVRARDKGRCVIPKCRDAAKHAHHITFRSQGGKWQSSNIVSLCPSHHLMVHASLIEITGNADKKLKITRKVK